MNPKLRRFLMYVLMPVVFIGIGYAILFFGGSDFIRMAKDELNLAMTKGAPDYPNGFDEELYKKVVDKGNANTWSEIPLPATGTSYAVLSCENLGIEADVYYGDNDESFSKGVGQYTGSHMFGCGKPILLGGHDTTYFAGLEKVKVGDAFEVLTNYGLYQYKVKETKIAKATDASAVNLSEDKETLILYTCYPFGEITSTRDDRYFVYCERVDHGATIKEVE